MPMPVPVPDPASTTKVTCGRQDIHATYDRHPTRRFETLLRSAFQYKEHVPWFSLCCRRNFRFPSSSPFPFNPAAILRSRRFRNMGRSYDYSIQSVRRRVSGNVLRGYLVPAGAILLALRLVGIKLGYASSALVFPLAALSGSYLLSLYKHNADAQEAKRLGAIQVPT